MAGRVRDMGDREFRQQAVDQGRAVGGVGLDQLGRGADVLLGGQPAEDRGFLRQVADAEARPAVHRQPRDVVAVERDRAVVGPEQTGDHIEAGGLARAVGAQQPHHLAALQRQADAAHHRAPAEALADARNGQPLEALDELWERPVGAVAELVRSQVFVSSGPAFATAVLKFCEFYLFPGFAGGCGAALPAPGAGTNRPCTRPVG